MTSDRKKDISNNICKDSHKTVSEVGQAGSDSKKLCLEGEISIEAVQNHSEQIKLAKEVNGPKGLEPTRYGDWEAKGRCYDF